MDFFIKKIFDGASDELVHLQFQKFSKGKFSDRALVKVKRSGEKYTIGTTYEYANELVRYAAGKLGEKKSAIKGVIVSTQKLKENSEFNKLLENSTVKQFMGIKQHSVDQEMSGRNIISLCDKFPRCFVALSFKTEDGTELKIKAKSPKSAKPSSKGDKKPPADFCKIKTTDKELVKNILFDLDISGFKLVEIDHIFLIEDLVLPEGESDPLKIRELAKRKGKIIRNIVVDEKETTKEKEFEA